MRRAFGLLAVTAAALFAAAAPAHARDFEVGMEDEGLLLSNPHLAAGRRARLEGAWASTWCVSTRAGGRSRRTATRPGPRPGSTRTTRTTRSTTGPRWTTRSRRSATSACAPMVTITGPGPLWTSGDTRKRNALWKPKPADYASFARAVATRYRDRVDRYLLWNEPNQKGWLQPQWTCDRRRRNCQPVSPHLYRSLVRAARARDPLRRPRQRDRGRRARAGRRPADQRTDADEAADLHARARLRGLALQERSAPAPAAGSRRCRRTRSAITRTRRSSRRTRSIPTRTRPSSATCSGCSRRWTSSRPASGCGSGARSI